jgi:GGDEF domain-containing protein
LAVLHIDLDRFKQANDSLGHDVSAPLQREAGRRPCGSVRDSDTDGRIGADEFALLLRAWNMLLPSPRRSSAATASPSARKRPTTDATRRQRHVCRKKAGATGSSWQGNRPDQQGHTQGDLAMASRGSLKQRQSLVMQAGFHFVGKVS